MNRIKAFILASFTISIIVFAKLSWSNDKPYYIDKPFIQDVATKYHIKLKATDLKLTRVQTDRNGNVFVASNKGLLRVFENQLIQDMRYRSIIGEPVLDIQSINGYVVLLFRDYIHSHAWAGKLFIELKNGPFYSFAIGEHQKMLLHAKNSAYFYHNGVFKQVTASTEDQFQQVLFNATESEFLLLSPEGIFSYKDNHLKKILSKKKINCFAIGTNNQLVLGCDEGYQIFNRRTLQPMMPLQKRLPVPKIRCLHVQGERLWFGTDQGAFVVEPDGAIQYYAAQRWLNDNCVVDITSDKTGNVYILTESGLSKIENKLITLAEKADFYLNILRTRHLRYGFAGEAHLNSSGDLSSISLIDEDNDGLWTAMYVAAECFRYAATKNPEAKRNAIESFEALERLSDINPIKGFPSRSFERKGYKWADKDRWHLAKDERWEWKGTTSSDEIVGHFFAYAILYELIEDAAIKQRVVTLVDDISEHILSNDLYLVDLDGKPTQWGRWNPEYVNGFPKTVGDRQLNSVEITGFFQLAYKLTGKEKYKQKIFELFEKHGYLDNIQLPLSELKPNFPIGDEWNHSDDELAFLSYYLLFHYAFNDSLKAIYQKVIYEHWKIEFPEKNSLWNFIYSSTGAKNFGLDDAIWTLSSFPLDMIRWSVKNSHRKDLTFRKPGFRNQHTVELLPVDERPMNRWNANLFSLDSHHNGKSELPGTNYLLPYWMGRFLGVIR